MPISNEHVSALNLVEVEFYECKTVEAAWENYKNHLNDTGRPEDEAWREKKENLLAKLLAEIASVLGFKIAAIDIFKGGYAPGGWAARDALGLSSLEFVRDLSMGRKLLPLWVANLAPNPNPPASPQEASSLERPPG
jgi:hypothetical protein